MDENYRIRYVPYTCHQIAVHLFKVENKKQANMSFWYSYYVLHFLVVLSCIQYFLWDRLQMSFLIKPICDFAMNNSLEFSFLTIAKKKKKLPIETAIRYSEEKFWFQTKLLSFFFVKINKNLRQSACEYYIFWKRREWLTAGNPTGSFGLKITSPESVSF